jgi:hypothetical protein
MAVPTRRPVAAKASSKATQAAEVAPVPAKGAKLRKILWTTPTAVASYAFTGMPHPQDGVYCVTISFDGATEDDPGPWDEFREQGRAAAIEFYGPKLGATVPIPEEKLIRERLPKDRKHPTGPLKGIQFKLTSKLRPLVVDAKNKVIQSGFVKDEEDEGEVQASRKKQPLIIGNGSLVRVQIAFTEYANKPDGTIQQGIKAQMQAIQIIKLVPYVRKEQGSPFDAVDGYSSVTEDEDAEGHGEDAFEEVIEGDEGDADAADID